ncbi:MAG TPA: MerR family transcriptional regulator [Verrucomicrobiota bacterium]|nr:MerR family transcriptional regulator [Verrucomicrobiota bacterium]
MKNSYSIGEFSQVTGLSVKTLRFYHEKGILTPSSVDEATGYRFYDASKIEKARVIMRLRAMEFSIEDIAAVMGDCTDEADILNQLERQRNTLQQRIREDRDIVRSLNEIISTEKAARELLESSAYDVVEKTVEPQLVAGIRMKGKYADCGHVFGQLGKAVGRFISGKPLCLYYDGEYRDGDADIEPCFPVRKPVAADGVSVRELPGGRCLTLVHRGPYDQLGRSYAKILKRAGAPEIKLTLPTREVYLKGPGMIFKGNPKNYLTEIQLPVG